jgi:hypothetical protein
MWGRVFPFTFTYEVDFALSCEVYSAQLLCLVIFYQSISPMRAISDLPSYLRGWFCPSAVSCHSWPDQTLDWCRRALIIPPTPSPMRFNLTFPPYLRGWFCPSAVSCHSWPDQTHDWCRRALIIPPPPHLWGSIWPSLLPMRLILPRRCILPFLTRPNSWLTQKSVFSVHSVTLDPAGSHNNTYKI